MRYLVVSTVFFLWIGITNAQKTESFNLENQPLRTALDQLEDKFKVTFSFSNDVIADILVDLKGDLNLQEALRSLQVQSALSFEMVRENNFLVYKSKDDGHENDGELDLITLENTIIKAYLTQGMDRNPNGSITVTPDKLSSLPGLIEPDVLQTVQLLPGINSSLETAADIQIRGGTPDQNLVLWDGIKMYHTGHYFGMFSAFNPFITDQIDVYRSATLSKYGDRVSGIIDIQSKDIVSEDFNGGIGINMTHADAYIQLPIIENKLSILVAARRSYLDLFSTYTSDRYFNRVFQSTRISTNSNLIIENEQLNELQNDVSFLDSNLKIQWRPSDKDEISLSALYLKNDLDYKIEDIIDQRTNTDELDLQNQGITLNWKRDWNPYWRHSIQTYYSDYVSDYLFSDNDISGLEEGNRRFNSVEDFGISVETVFQPNEKNVWSLGYQYYNTQVEFVLSRLDDLQEDFLDSSSSNLNSHNIFLNYEKQWKQFILNAGLRTTFLSSPQNWYFEPRINATYKLSNALAISASAEVKNQAISQFIEIESPLQLANNIWTIADDEDYFVINSQQLTFGVTYNKNSWNIDVEAYYKKLNNLSSYLRGFSNVATTNTDLFSKGSGETIGIDLLIKKKVNNYNTWIGYTLSRTRQEFPDIQTESFPSLSDKTHSLQWINQYKWNQLELSLGAQYSTGNPYTRGIGISEDENQDFFIEYGPINNSRLRDYFRLDGSIFYNFKSKSNDFVKAKLGISFINLLNRENELNRTYAIDEFSDDETPEVRDLILEEETILGLRFTPNIVFRYWF